MVDFKLMELARAGFLPGAILIISKWYLPNETQTRIAILYTSAATGGGFSGLLAFAIAKLNGVGGYEGWRWVCDVPTDLQYCSTYSYCLI
jgi:MFS family permease